MSAQDEGRAHDPAQAARCHGLVLNVPAFFADPDFREWLVGETTKFTWHRGGAVDEWSDVVMLVDPGLEGDGSDSDMPELFWTQIVELCRVHLGPAPGHEHHYMVRLTNLTI
ncbi:hypothetical protein [Novosphingobium sp. CCH12-A3]|uniref:hypothetical protein n=1 Tax=Novosphingobium sp. CCH12-A3 TaxID=1768752 RepID=UPI0007849E37|nr:hypothetical protein [Novosphingobium sp. CCH12-A3]